MTPTSLQASFGQGPRRVHYLERVDAGEVDLQKLTRLHRLLQEAYEGQIEPATATAEVETIRAADPGYPRPILALGFALASGSAARVFAGGPAEIGVSAVAGLLVGLLMVYGVSVQRMQRLIVSLASFTAAMAVGILANFVEIVLPICLIASLIVLLPAAVMIVAIVYAIRRRRAQAVPVEKESVT